MLPSNIRLIPSLLKPVTWLQAIAASALSKELSQTVPQALFKQSSSLPDLVVLESTPSARRASPVVQFPMDVETSIYQETFADQTFMIDNVVYLDKQLQQLDMSHP